MDNDNGCAARLNAEAAESAETGAAPADGSKRDISGEAAAMGDGERRPRRVVVSEMEVGERRLAVGAMPAPR